MAQPYIPIDYSQYQRSEGDKGKWGAFGTTPPPGMLNPHTLTNGFGYTFGEQEGQGEGRGTSNLTRGSFSKAAGYLLQGSQMAAGSALQGFESMYRARAQGEAAAFGEQQDRLGGEVASQGYSPDLVRRMLLGGQAQSQARIGQARGEADQGYQQFLAELQRNTGVELSDLSMEEMNFIQQAYLAKQARKAGEKAGYIGLAGSAMGAAGAAAGGLGGGSKFKSSSGIF